MVETPNGNIWVSDGMSSAIAVLDADGRFLQSFGRGGEGPGEFTGPGRLAVTPSGSVAVLDIGRSSIELFHANGRFDTRVLLDHQPFNVKGFLALDDGSYLISGGIYSQHFAVHRFNSSGEWERGFGRRPEPTLASPQTLENMLYVTGGPIAVREDGSVLYSQAAPHRITVEREGDRSREFASDPRVLAPIVDSFAVKVKVDGQTQTHFRWFFDQSRGVVVSGNHVINAITFEERGSTLWQAYDDAGELVATTESPVEYWVWGSAENGDLLATRWDPATDEQAAVRLRVTISDG